MDKMPKNNSAIIFILLNAIFISAVTFYSFAEEVITLTTYFPAPYGVYRELRVNQIAVGSRYRQANLTDGTLLVSGDVVLGSVAFKTVQGDRDCPEGYEIYSVRWQPKECKFPLPLPSEFEFIEEELLKCTTEKFVWASDSIPKCRYCIEAEKVRLSITEKQIHNTEEDFAYFCTKMSECLAEKKEYTLCVKEPGI